MFKLNYYCILIKSSNQFKDLIDNFVSLSSAGVPHTAEIPFVFGEPFGNDTNWTDTDRRVSTDVMTMWTNLAKYGSVGHNLHYSLSYVTIYIKQIELATNLIKYIILFQK